MVRVDVLMLSFHHTPWLFDGLVLVHRTPQLEGAGLWFNPILPFLWTPAYGALIAEEGPVALDTNLNILAGVVSSHHFYERVNVRLHSLPPCHVCRIL